MQFNWAEKTCRRFASDEMKALIDKLDTDDEFRKNYFEGTHDNRTIAANYILNRRDATYKLSMWDDRYAYHALCRIRSEYKIRKTKDAILHIVMDTLEDEKPKVQTSSPGYYSLGAGGLGGMGSLISSQNTANTALQALAQKYQQQLNQQVGQNFYP